MKIFYFARSRGSCVLFQECYATRKLLNAAVRDAGILFGNVKVRRGVPRFNFSRVILTWPAFD